jgi:hypothetical protein
MTILRTLGRSITTVPGNIVSGYFTFSCLCEHAGRPLGSKINFVVPGEGRGYNGRSNSNFLSREEKMVRLIGGLMAVWFLCVSVGLGVATAEGNQISGVLLAKKDKEKEEKALKEKEEQLEARERALQTREEELNKREADLKKREEALKKKPPRSRQQTPPGAGAGPQGPSGNGAGFGPKMPAPAGVRQAYPAPSAKPVAPAPASPGKQ